MSPNQNSSDINISLTLDPRGLVPSIPSRRRHSSGRFFLGIPSRSSCHLATSLDLRRRPTAFSNERSHLPKLWDPHDPTGASPGSSRPAIAPCPVPHAHARLPRTDGRGAPDPCVQGVLVAVARASSGSRRRRPPAGPHRAHHLPPPFSFPSSGHS